MNIGHFSYRSNALSPPDQVEVDESPYVERLVASAEFFGDTICESVGQLRVAYIANDPIALQKWIGDLLEREAAKSLSLAADKLRMFTPSAADIHGAYETACHEYEKYDRRAA